MKQKIIKFINNKYNASPEYLWKRYPTYCIFRHHDNNKWFALIGTVPRSILKLSGDGDIDILNFWLLGKYVHYIRNYAVENGQGEEFAFKLEDECWGKFAEGESNNETKNYKIYK